jgi:hypothetical protein
LDVVEVERSRLLTLEDVDLVELDLNWCELEFDEVDRAVAIDGGSVSSSSSSIF